MSHVCDFLHDAAWGEVEEGWMTDADGTCSRSTFHRRVTQLASFLRSAFAVPIGSRVAFLASSTTAFLQALLACLCNGWIVVSLNTRWSEKESRSALLSVQPELLFFDQTASAAAHALVQGTKVQLVLIGGGDQAIGGVPCTEMMSLDVKQEIELRRPSDDSALICFTSGTTGAPKGVTLSHRALCFQCLYKIALCGYEKADVYLHAAPLFHVGGLVSALAMLHVGARHVLMKKFNPEHAAHQIQRHSVSALIAVPAMITDLASLKKITFPSVKKLLIGGGTPNCQQALMTGMLFPNAHFWMAYGMTEASSSLTYAGPFTPAQLQKGIRDLGYAIPGTSITINATTGEVLAKGPHLMRYYWNDEASTAAAFTSDGWLRTGDVGAFTQNGALRLKGRLKDMIKSGGENVYPSEIEAVLIQHPAVQEVAVVGVPHPRLGETLCAVIVLKPCVSWDSTPHPSILSRFLGTPPRTPKHVLSPLELRAHCMNVGLTGFKVPRLFLAQCAPLPRSSTGKLVQHDIQRLVRHIIPEANGRRSISTLSKL